MTWNEVKSIHDRLYAEYGDMSNEESYAPAIVSAQRDPLDVADERVIRIGNGNVVAYVYTCDYPGRSLAEIGDDADAVEVERLLRVAMQLDDDSHVIRRHDVRD